MAPSPRQTPRSVYNALLAIREEADELVELVDVYHELRDMHGLLEHADSVTFQTFLQGVRKMDPSL